MAKNKVSEWSSAPASNTDVGGIDIAEGCAPSGINNAIREIMSQVKDMQAGTDGDNFTVGGNLNVTGTTALTGALSLTVDLAVADGGTGASTAADARTNLGLGTIATQAANSVTITGGSITGITDLAVADGGTGSSTLSANAVLLGNGTSALQTVAPSTSGNVLTSDGTTWISAANNKFTRGTSANTTSGTSVDITGIPSWVRRITVSFYNNSWNSNAIGLLQVGTSGGIVSTGYVNNGAEITSSPNPFTSTAGIPIAATGSAADFIYGGIAILTNISGNVWIYTVEGSSGNQRYMNAGNISLSGTLDRVRFTSTTAATFDAGSFNIMYE